MCGRIAHMVWTSLVCGNEILGILTDASGWFRSHQPVSWFTYVVIFVGSTGVLLPFSPLAISVGYIYGWGPGMLVRLLV